MWAVVLIAQYALKFFVIHVFLIFLNFKWSYFYDAFFSCVFW